MSHKISIDMDAQSFAEIMLVFKRIASALESIDEKQEKPKSTQPNFVDHRIANKPAPVRQAGKNSR